MLYDKYSTITILFKGVLSVKKYLAFILTGAMMCTMLTGCAGGKTEPAAGNSGLQLFFATFAIYRMLHPVFYH